MKPLLFPAPPAAVSSCFLFVPQTKEDLKIRMSSNLTECLSEINFQHTKNIRYVQTMPCILTQLFFGLLQLLVCPFTPAFNIYSTIQMLTKIVNNIRVKPTLVNTQNNKINIDNHLQCRKNKFAGFVFCS